MSNEVAILLNEIQFRTGFTLEQIDEKVGYSRPYLNNVKIKGGGEKLLAKLKHEYAEILQNVPRNTPIADKAKAYDALFSVLIADYAAWKGQVSDYRIAWAELDRIAKLIGGTLTYSK